MTQREIAERSGLRLGTYGNVESSPFRVLKRAKVERILRELDAGPEASAEVLAAYDAAPMSAFQIKQRAAWDKRNAERASHRKAPTLERALVRLLSLRYSEGDVCDCTADADRPFTCELCDAVRALDLGDRYGADTGDALAERERELGLDDENASSGDSQRVDNPEDNGADFG